MIAFLMIGLAVYMFIGLGLCFILCWIGSDYYMAWRHIFAWIFLWPLTFIRRIEK